MIFIDAGAFIAWYRESDACHKSAAAGWTTLETSGQKRLTSSLVFDEVMRGLARYGGVRVATTVGRDLLASDTFIVNPTTQDTLDALDLMERYQDQAVGFTDCVSFVLMKKNRIRRVFGFDRHFQAAGFELWPARK